MVVFFCPEHRLGAGIIEHYKLKKNMEETHFETFRSETTKLVVTGMGETRAAMAVAYFMARHEYSADDVFVGIKESQDFEIYNEIRDKTEDRRYYPDMCNTSFYETRTDNCELAGIYKALVMFVKQHQILLLGMPADNNRNGLDLLVQCILEYPDIYRARHPFSHVYVEEKVKDEEYVSGILGKLKNSRVIYIRHYKDVFNRTGQDRLFQKNSPALILAKREGRAVFDGSRECQNFGNRYFYYASSIMNCMFDCEYCYLQGMYPSADIVVFVNIENIFSAIDGILKEHPAYICISYDTDLIALEPLCGYTSRWIDFAEKRKDLTLEIRTKGELPTSLTESFSPKECENIIFAFTLSPKMVQLRLEHGTLSVDRRISLAARLVSEGYKVRLCFDPILCSSDAEESYRELIDSVFGRIDGEKILDVSLGQFRIPAGYMKKIKKSRKQASQYFADLKKCGDNYSYGVMGTELSDKVFDMIRKYVSEDRIYRWDL